MDRYISKVYFKDFKDLKDYSYSFNVCLSFKHLVYVLSILEKNYICIKCKYEQINNACKYVIIFKGL